MDRTIDYYLAPQSPWTYLGHQRLADIADKAGAQIRVRPVDLGGKIFPVSGGLPLQQRAAQRQAYRLLELARHSEHLGLPLNLHPKYFPVPGDEASRLIIATDLEQGGVTAMRLAGAVLAAVWVQERNIADRQVLAALLQECQLPAQGLERAQSPEIQALYEAYTQEAIAKGVFGAPSYLVDGELFWGQDRLDFLARRLG
ncbi:MAG: 2-hydroxychromene-2-carboxylate isomerase [Hylemonella sp.]|nr:2-hydroxychromene-2-carboxylate isomerase [Hylemonella sp.]